MRLACCVSLSDANEYYLPKYVYVGYLLVCVCTWRKSRLAERRFCIAFFVFFLPQVTCAMACTANSALPQANWPTQLVPGCRESLDCWKIVSPFSPFRIFPPCCTSLVAPRCPREPQRGRKSKPPPPAPLRFHSDRSPGEDPGSLESLESLVVQHRWTRQSRSQLHTSSTRSAAPPRS